MSRKVKCRVCGKEYIPCRSAAYDPRVFNWKEVACTQECGQIYLERILASRAVPHAQVVEEKEKKTTKKKKAMELIPEETPEESGIPIAEAEQEIASE